jgi:hypothetical protein
LQVIRDWVLRFNADGPNGLIDRKASGPSPKLNNEQRRALARVVENGPIAAIHGIVRWRLKDLAQWIAMRPGGHPVVATDRQHPAPQPQNRKGLNRHFPDSLQIHGDHTHIAPPFNSLSLRRRPLLATSTSSVAL